jgi:hypothetical protein
MTYYYTKRTIVDVSKNSAVTINVSLKINFSIPLLVNEDEFEPLPKPVPRTCSKTKIITSIADVDCKT